MGQRVVGIELARRLAKEYLTCQLGKLTTELAY